MGDILFQYHKVNPTTWVYLSSLLTIGLYFKFSRLWSVRNLDLIGLILFAPGLLAVDYGVAEHAPTVEQVGYIWLFAMSAIFMVRLLLDPMMVRRPLLEPNLSVGGMTFIGTSLLVFLMANVINSKPTLDDRIADKIVAQRGDADVPAADDAADADADNADAVAADADAAKTAADAEAARRQSSPLLNLLSLPPFIAHWILAPDASQESRNLVYRSTVRTMAILSHMAVVIGMVVIGYRHFDNIKTGIAAAMLYLLLPYTAQMTGRVDHVLTAALLVWAIEAYRRPAVAGVIMGLAIGVTYYPVFLLPLWLGFYWQRGLVRFVAGVASMILLVLLSLLLTSNGLADFWLNLKDIFGWSSQAGAAIGFSGFWGFEFIDPVYRIPVLAAFFALCGSLALWPAQKNLGTLLSCSAAVMLGTQFWHPRGGGLFMAWYLPLMLLTIFRPNLEDRVALSVLGEGWFPRRKANLGNADLAA